MMFKQLCAVALLGVAMVSHAETITRLPKEIYHPHRATLIKAKEGRSDITATFSMRGGNVVRFAQDIISHAKKHGFRVMASEIDAEEADIDFARGERKMSVSVDLQTETTMKYRVELDK